MKIVIGKKIIIQTNLFLNFFESLVMTSLNLPIFYFGKQEPKAGNSIKGCPKENRYEVLE
jgi:hypothetical protein